MKEELKDLEKKLGHIALANVMKFMLSNNWSAKAVSEALGEHRGWLSLRINGNVQPWLGEFFFRVDAKLLMKREDLTQTLWIDNTYGGDPLKAIDDLHAQINRYSKNRKP